MFLEKELEEYDDNRFSSYNVLNELKYMGHEIPRRRAITNDDIRFYAWLCRRAADLLDKKPDKTAEIPEEGEAGPWTGKN